MFLALAYVAQAVLAQSALAQAPNEAQEAFWDALREDDISTVIAEVSAGVSPNTINIQNTETPLTYAVKRSSIEMVAALLEAGANVNQVQPISMFSPLMVAAKHQNTEAADLLIRYHANANSTGIFGRNALDIAALHNSVEIARLLVTQTNVNINSRVNLCSLAVASRQGNAEIVKIILSSSQKPAEKCVKSARQMAELNQHSEIIAILK